MDQQYQITDGTDVVGSDGEKVGQVVAVQPSYIVVEKGFFFPTDYYIPTTAVADADGDKVYLSVSKDEALNQGWDTMPTDDAYATTTTTSTSYDTATVPTSGSTVDMGVTETVATGGRRAGGSVELDEDDVPFEHYEDTDRSHLDADQGVVVPVHEEELAAVTREREVGQVEITKDVVAERQTLEVPVTEERVRVERRAVDRDASVDDTAFQGGTIEVPLRAEEVELQKRTRVAEEIEIGKEAVQSTEQVTGTVRREVVNVEEQLDNTTTNDSATSNVRNTRKKKGS